MANTVCFFFGDAGDNVSVSERLCLNVSQIAQKTVFDVTKCVFTIHFDSIQTLFLMLSSTGFKS